MPSGRQNLVRDADAQAAEALALALDLDDLIRPAWRVDATWVPAAPWAGWLLGGYGEQAAQVIGPGRVAGYPDRVVSGPAPQPAQHVPGRAVDHRPRIVAGAVFDLYRVRRRADRPGRLACGDRDLARPGQVTALYLGE